jgi:Putative transposase/Transposase zinc-binding domain
MIEVADVFRRFAGSYLSAHGASMPPSHQRAITDILACRTDALGGHLWRCDECAAEVFSYHSCKNRSCPKCHTDQTERWIEARNAEMLPTRYFHVTLTVPEELREVLRANQRDGYAVLIKTAAEAIIELARDPRYVGGTVGVLAVLHTWTQQLLFHPHVHCLVTGGGVSDDGEHWHPARDAFLVPVKALAKLLRGKLRAAFEKRRPDLVLPEAAWSKPWVVHCTAWREGEQAVLDYLARYVFRVAITNTRIVGLDDETVTIRHKHRKSNRWRTSRISGHEFMRRFLQHVLPKGLHKVRYFGLWHPSKREHAARARLHLSLASPAMARETDLNAHTSDQPDDNADPDTPRICPHCNEGHLVHIRRLSPKRARGP